MLVKVVVATAKSITASNKQKKKTLVNYKNNKK